MKKFGPFEIRKEIPKDLTPNYQFMGQMLQILGILFMLQLGLKSIQHEDIETYGTITGWILIVAVVLIVRSRIKGVTKKDVTGFTNHFIRIEKKNKGDK